MAVATPTISNASCFDIQQTLTGLLATGGDGATRSFQLTTIPGHGHVYKTNGTTQLALNDFVDGADRGDGTYTYQFYFRPAASYTGTDTFVIKGADGAHANVSVAGATATVTVSSGFISARFNTDTQQLTINWAGSVQYSANGVVVKTPGGTGYSQLDQAPTNDKSSAPIVTAFSAGGAATAGHVTITAASFLDQYVGDLANAAVDSTCTFVTNPKAARKRTRAMMRAR